MAAGSGTAAAARRNGLALALAARSAGLAVAAALLASKRPELLPLAGGLLGLPAVLPSSRHVETYEAYEAYRRE